MKVVIDHQILWDHGHLYPIVLISGHWRVYVELFCVHAHVFDSFSGNHAIEVSFDGCEV